jgi:formamidopyrimidine-DNA glycosylase
MPELPEIELYLHALESRIVGQPLERIRIASIALLKTFDPPVSVLEGRAVRSVRRLGKRVVLDFDDDLHAVIHLMIAGRFQWKPRAATIPKRLGQAAFDFPGGTLLLTEAGTKKRASLHVVQGEANVQSLARGGIEVLEIPLDEFNAALTRENRTLKRALTDPRIFSGIGNAHSDEILFHAGLSPVQLTRNLSAHEVERLYDATRSSLLDWIRILRSENETEFPSKITAFHPLMHVHGRYGEPCTVCGSPIQRIVYASNETNYCAQCQTGGRLLADRALSRLLKGDWPRTLEELE